MTTDTFPLKDPADVWDLPFDFSKALNGAAISSITVDVEQSTDLLPQYLFGKWVSVGGGTDPAPNAIKLGAPQSDATGTVTQRVTGGVTNVVYKLRVQVTSDSGQTFVAAALLPVLHK